MFSLVRVSPALILSKKPMDLIPFRGQISYSFSAHRRGSRRCAPGGSEGRSHPGQCASVGRVLRRHLMFSSFSTSRQYPRDALLLHRDAVQHIGLRPTRPRPRGDPFHFICPGEMNPPGIKVLARREGPKRLDGAFAPGSSAPCCGVT